MDWSRWNPFKFKRTQKQEQSVPVLRGGGGTPLPQAPVTYTWPNTVPQQMLQEFWRDPFAGFANLAEPSAGLTNIERWFGDFSASRFIPSVDVVDDGGALRVEAELPGLEKDDIDVIIEDGSLMLKGEKKYDASHEQDGCYRIERAHGMFARTIPLPSGLDTDKAEAKFKNGVLEVSIPKLEEASSGRKLAIK